MKQGVASRNVVETKSEPVNRVVNPGGAAQLGQIQGSRNAKIDLYGERHGQAPQSANHIHNHGSQGKR